MKEPKLTHLSKRNGVYYFRRKVPLDLRQHYGKNEIIFSLQTKSRSEAEALARRHGVTYDEEFAKTRTIVSGRDISLTLTPSPSSSIHTTPKLSDGLTMRDVDILIGRFWDHYRQLREQAVTNDPRTFEQFMIRMNGIVQDCKEQLSSGEHPLWDSTEPLWIVEARMKAVEAITTGVMPSPSVLYAMPPQPQAMAPASSASTSYKSLLTDVLDSWAKERKPDARTATQYKRVINKFIEYTSVMHIEDITKKHVVKYKDKLLEDGVSTPTTNNYLVNLTTICNFAVSNALIEVNPATGIRVQVQDEDLVPRDPYTVDQLNKLFSSPIYTESYRPLGGKGDAAYWIPLLGLFTGARLNEICQLLKTDIRIEQYYDDKQARQECWIADITDLGPAQRLKNTISKRRAPIHPALIDLGFIDFVNASPGPRVFHELMPAKAYNSISANWSKWYSRYMKKIGLKTDALVFHSFRHSFKYFARLNSIPDAHQFAIQGHSTGNVGDKYGGAVYPLAPLVEAMDKYQIPNLVLPPKIDSTKLQ